MTRRYYPAARLTLGDYLLFGRWRTGSGSYSTISRSAVTPEHYYVEPEETGFAIWPAPFLSEQCQPV